MISRPVVLLLALSSSLCFSFSQNITTERRQAEIKMAKGYESALADKPDSAAAFFRDAAEAFCEIQDWEKARYCLNGEGRALIQSGQFTRALLPLKRAGTLPVGRSQSDVVERARTFELIGYVHTYEDRTDSAIGCLENALSIRERYFGEDHAGLAQTLYLLGLAHLKKGAPEEALLVLQRALHLHQRSSTQDRRDLANILIATGNAYQAKGDYTLSIRSYDNALKTVREVSEATSAIEAACHFYLGESYRTIGEFRKAVVHLQTALMVYRRLNGDISQTVLSCHRQLGDVFTARGDWDEALASYRTCLVLMEKLNGERHSSIGDIYGSLSTLYRERGEPDTALVYSLRALDILRSALGPGHPDLGWILETIGSIYAEKQNLTASLEYYHAALELRTSVNATAGLDFAAISCRIGSLYSHMEMVDSAEAYFLEALRILETTPDQGTQLRARTCRELGDIHSRRGDLAGALLCYDDAIRSLSPSPLSGGTDTVNEFDGAIEFIAARKAQADVFSRQYSVTHSLSDLREAFRALDEATDMIERQRCLLASEGSKFAVEENTHSLHERAAEMALELYGNTGDEKYLIAAQETVERNRAGALLDALRELNAQHFAGIPDSLIELERSLRNQLAQCAIRIQTADSRGVPLPRQEQDEIVRRQFILMNTLHQLRDTFRNNYPAYYELQYDEHIAARSRVLPDRGTALLEYFVGDRSIFIFITRRDKLEAYVEPKPPDFEDLITSVRTSIKTIDADGFVRSSVALYELLIKPVETDLAGVRHLIVIPDGPLYAVPFEALVSDHPDQDPSGRQIDFTRLSYLIRTFDISYAYSVRTLEQQTMRSSAPPWTFLGIAPVFTDSLNRNPILADNSFFRGRDSNLVRSITIDGRKFKQLPFSEDEVLAIAASFAQMGTAGRELTHEAATEEEFKSEAGKYAFVHIATHGILDEEHPSLSALLFAPPPDGARDDGILFAAEAYTLNLNADLVVLSSCESGMGKFTRGEGMLSMTRGFVFAGARNVMFSLWKVYDRHTSQLMARFYGGIHQGLSFSEALREAKLTLINNPATAFPAKWAGFILLGGHDLPDAGSLSESSHNEPPDRK